MFNTFSPHRDIVRVAYQSQSQKQTIGDFTGKVGFIEEFNQDHSRALFQAITIDGKLAGTAWLPVKCLVRESSPNWTEAYVKYQEWFKNITNESNIRRNRFEARLSEIASRYSLRVEDVLDITQQVSLA